MACPYLPFHLKVLGKSHGLWRRQFGNARLRVTNAGCDEDIVVEPAEF